MRVEPKENCKKRLKSEQKADNTGTSSHARRDKIVGRNVEFTAPKWKTKIIYLVTQNDGIGGDEAKILAASPATGRRKLEQRDHAGPSQEILQGVARMCI